jgi:RNA polymerase sigma-70 factor (ECF subfamily)
VKSDIEAVEAIKGGDRERYTELVERYQRMVYGIVWSRLGDADLCEDAAQETFVKAFRYLVGLRNPAKFSGWLARIARNVSNSMLRKRKRELEKRHRWRLETPTEQRAEVPLEEDEPIGRTLTQTLASLPERHRECLVLFYLEGKNVRDTAAVLGISEVALKTRLHRARKVLRGRLEEELASSLSGLGPRAGFSACVMPLMPALPLASVGISGLPGGVKGAGLLGKYVSPLFTSVWTPLVFGMTLLQGLNAAFFFAWLGELEVANLAPSPQRRLRGKIIRSNVVGLVMVIFVVLVFVPMFGVQFGFLAIFQYGTLFLLWGTYSAARVLRINRSLFAIGNVISCVAFLFIYVSIGFFHVPIWIFSRLCCR